jgi:peroxiredoxin
MKVQLPIGLERRGARWAIVMGLAVSLAINCLQGYRISQLGHDLMSLHAQGSLSVGSIAPTLRLRDLKGNITVLDYSSTSSPTLLYVCEPSCAWCMRNDRAVNTLAAKIQGRYRIVGVSLSEDGLAGFIDAHEVRFPAWTLVGLSGSEYGLTSTPQTIVISPEGHVLASWKGAYSPSVKPLIERFFSVELPTIESL